ncbi:MAG: preprotein translocase subunit SecE [Planctomycetota bacterium]
MSYGIYKPNQGYWVRVLTAIGAGILVLATAVWAWNQAGAAPLPTPTWRVTFAAAEGAMPQPGATLSLVDRGGPSAEPLELGTATVESATPGAREDGTLVIGTLAMNEGYDPTSTDQLNGDAGFSAQVADIRGIPVIERTYLQGGAAGVVMLIGSVLIYLFVASRRKSVEFLIATDGEMKKVNWSTRKEVTGSTVVVVVATFLIAAILFVIDLGFSNFFQLINVLER